MYGDVHFMYFFIGAISRVFLLVKEGARMERQELRGNSGGGEFWKKPHEPLPPDWRWSPPPPAEHGSNGARERVGVVPAGTKGFVFAVAIKGETTP